MGLLERRGKPRGGGSGQTGDRDVAKHLKSLPHKKKERRTQAALALVGLGATGVRALIEAIRGIDAKGGYRDEMDRQARMAAVDALREIRDPESVDVLLEVIDQGNEWNELGLMGDVVSAFGFNGDVRAVPALVRVLGRDSSMKAHACWALGRIGGTEAVEALRRALADAANPRVQVAALKALEELGVGPQEDEGDAALTEVRRRAAIKDVFDGWHSGSSFENCASCGVKLLTLISKAVPVALLSEFFKKGFHFSRSGVAISEIYVTLTGLPAPPPEPGGSGIGGVRVSLCKDCAWDVATFAVDTRSP